MSEDLESKVKRLEQYKRDVRNVLMRLHSMAGDARLAFHDAGDEDRAKEWAVQKQILRALAMATDSEIARVEDYEQQIKAMAARIEEVKAERAEFERKASLFDEILAIAGQVPKEVWQSVPTNLAETKGRG